MKRHIVFTNGCFYLLHPGHIALFKKIRAIYPSNNFKLIVGINSNDSISKLKQKRPYIMSNEDRKNMIESIKYVDEAIVFNDDTPEQLIIKIKPDIIIKGEDYMGKNIVGQDIAKKGVTFLKNDLDYSTSNIIKTIVKLS
jgi:D-beta-D-heptose 7-phosphate kinase/D-beta-D-heptose 1-phosphate adenosyltransferase